ncbi:MAG TPA: EAL domain-containing protein [Usitatibacter sp.]|nr:EAL domain-containing protein [Usitatibacter sp.]
MKAHWLAALLALAVQAAAAFDIPAKLVVVTDENYPPFLFRGDDGALRGIVKDKWELWSRRTGVPVEVLGTSWAEAQESVRAGRADVIESLAQTRKRAESYEFTATPVSIDAHVYFHRSITGITDPASMRGFTVAAKDGSACADWLRAHQAGVIRGYRDSEELVRAAAVGEVRLFCMDSLAAEYFLFKHGLGDEFRRSPPLYSAPFGWAVRRGRAQLRDFVQAGFERIGNAEMAEIESRWRGNPVPLPISTRHLAYLIVMGVVALAFSAFILFSNYCLRRVAGGRTLELGRAVEALKKHAARATYFATRDPLTDLPNRQLLHDRLALELSHARERGLTVGLILIDLDRFKAVNDTFGQEFGDRVLKRAAMRLVRCAGPGATVARVSGDEFVIVLAPSGVAETGAVASGAIARLRNPFDIDGQRVYCTASAGVVICPNDGTTPAELLRNAAIAMDCAKENGRNNAQHYRAEMQQLAARRLALETELRGALDRSEFEVYYQPRVSVASGRVSGFEALLRWRHPAQGLLAPGEFIPILEDTGLIVPVGEWVLLRVCRQIRDWQAMGLEVLPIAVNLSARQFHQRDLDGVVARIVVETGIDPALLELELTESVLMREPEEAARSMRRLQAMGIHIAVDDFGTGYSSLAYLKRFPIAALKVDRAFISDVTRNPEDAAITIAIINLAHSLGMKVVAEGVEGEEQLEFLRLHRCDEYQGYLFSPPVPVADAMVLLSSVARPPLQ